MITEKLPETVKLPDNKEVKQDQVIPTPPFKLKNKLGRNYIRFNLIDTFGFMPEDVVISRVFNENNQFTLSAVLTPDMLKEKERLEKLRAQNQADKIMVTSKPNKTKKDIDKQG